MILPPAPGRNARRALGEPQKKLPRSAAIVLRPVRVGALEPVSRIAARRKPRTGGAHS